ncbi:aminopeptidase P family N-terminal domain-containing protein, partial [Streptomyces sparsus]
MSEVHTLRRSRLRERCAASAADSTSALVSSPANIRYLSGVEAPGAVLLLGADGRYTLLARPGEGSAALP